MGDRLKGKRAFVTAGAAGIGRASAIAFAREGASVFATDIDEKGLALLAREGVSEVARLDVRDTSAVAEMAKRVGPIDILMNAAGFVHNGTVLDCSDEDWDFSFDLNVKSMHRTIRAFLPGMLEKGHGSIVNISSAAGVVQGRAQPLRLRRDQSRGGGADPRGRRRFHHQGHPLQLHLPRHHRDAVDAQPRRGSRPRRARDVRGATTDGAARHRGRDRLARALSRQRRKRVHHRRGPYHRRRLDALRSFRVAQKREPGISKFPDAQLRI